MTRSSQVSLRRLNRLTEEEREYVKLRLQQDQGKSALERRITFRDVMNCFRNYKFFLGGFMYFGFIVPAYASLSNSQ